MAQSEDDHSSYDINGLQFALFMVFMTFYTFIGSAVSYHKLKFLSESGVSILLGIGLSVILFYQFDVQILMTDFHFIYFFVPPIILAEGFNLRKQHLISNIGYSFVYGYVGTTINFLLLYALLSYVNNDDYIMTIDYDPTPGHGFEVDQKEKLNLYEILLMSASLSSKDSFSATQMIDHHAVPILHSLVFGEGIINDAASLALFESIQSHPQNYRDQNFTIGDIFTLIGFVILNFIISVSFGIIFGIIGSLFLKYAVYLRKSAMYELMFIFCISLVSYSLVECIYYSGILSLLVTGLILGSYGWYNLTEKAKIASNVTFQFFSTFTESIVFLFLGLTSFLDSHNVYNFKLIGLCIAFIIIGRLVIVFVLGFFMGIWNRFSKFPIPFKQWFIFFWSGTPRGILSYSLMSKLSSPRQYMILSTIQIVVIITTLFFGSSLQFIQWLLINKEMEKQSAHHTYEQNKKKCLLAKRHIMEGERHFDQSLYNNKIEYYLTKFNQLYIKPFLIYHYFQRQKEIEASKILFKEDRWEIFNPDDSNKKQLLDESEEHYEVQDPIVFTEKQLNQQQIYKLEDKNIMQTNVPILRKGSLIDFIIKRQNSIFADNREKIFAQQAQQYDNLYKDKQNQNIEMLSHQPSFDLQTKFNIQ